MVDLFTAAISALKHLVLHVFDDGLLGVLSNPSQCRNTSFPRCTGNYGKHDE